MAAHYLTFLRNLFLEGLKHLESLIDPLIVSYGVQMWFRILLSNPQYTDFFKVRHIIAVPYV